jgi:hypothetical protein
MLLGKQKKILAFIVNMYTYVEHYHYLHYPSKIKNNK